MTGNKSEHHCCLGGMRVCKTWARAYHFISKNGSASIEKCPFGFYINLHPLNQVRTPPKLHRLFGTTVSPVGAFYSIKFGQLSGKIEVGRQHMLIAIYAKSRVFD